MNVCVYSMYLGYITLVEIKEGYLFCLQKGKGFRDENFRELNAYCLPLPLSFPHLFVPCLTYYFKPNWSFVVYLLYSRPGDTNAYCLDIQLCSALHLTLGSKIYHTGGIFLRLTKNHTVRSVVQSCAY